MPAVPAQYFAVVLTPKRELGKLDQPGEGEQLEQQEQFGAESQDERDQSSELAESLVSPVAIAFAGVSALPGAIR